MNLVSFSIKTKGAHNFTRRLWTVFTRFGFSEAQTRRALNTVINILGQYNAAPTFFIPAVVLRPHFEGTLLRIPTSIPDDEMLFDRLRITEPEEVGRIWSRVMQRIYDLGGLYTLNLHPERAILCKEALHTLLAFAHTRPLPVWLASLKDIARWWNERSQFTLDITPLSHARWQVVASCTS